MYSQSIKQQGRALFANLACVTYVHPFLQGPTPLIFAHRGLHTSTRENTLAAFDAAIASGATHLETDVQVTADGVAVLYHDDTLITPDRGRQSIGQLTRSEIENALGGSNQLASLVDALAHLPHAKFNIDVKHIAAVDEVVSAITESASEDRVLLTSFSNQTVQALVAKSPLAAHGAPRGAVIGLKIAQLFNARRWARRLSRDIDALQVPETAFGLRIVTRRFVDFAHDLHLQVHVWTVNDLETMRRLLDIGIDGIVTDRCDLAATLR